VLWPGRKLNWVSSRFRSTISRHPNFLSTWHTLYTVHFSTNAKERDSSVVSAFTPDSLLVYRVITPACQSFGALPEHQATWHTRFSQRTPQSKALSISGRISSQRAAAGNYMIKKDHLQVNSRFWPFKIGLSRNLNLIINKRIHDKNCKQKHNLREVGLIVCIG